MIEPTATREELEARLKSLDEAIKTCPINTLGLGNAREQTVREIQAHAEILPDE